MKFLDNLYKRSKSLLFAAPFFLSGLTALEAYADHCFFIKPADWREPYVWAWDDNDNNCCYNTSWPGDAMTLVDESQNLYRWDSKEGNSPTMLIIHDNFINRMRGINSVKEDGDTPFVDGVIYLYDSTYSIGGDDPVILSDGPGAIEFWERNDNTVTVACESATLFITPYSREVIKVFTLPKDTEEQERQTITVSATPDCDFKIIDKEGEPLLISIPEGAAASIDRETGLITFLDSEGNEKLSEAKYLRNEGNTHTVSFNPMGDTAFFGGGYNGRTGNIIDKSLRIDNTQTGGWGQERYDYPHCIAIPFVASTSGYGVLFDDHWRGAVMRPSSAGLSYSSQSRNPISYYYVGGENLDKVIANYTLLTGRQNLPPYWALGYITSRYGYKSEEEAQGYINAIKAAGIPLDGIVFDLYWEGADESGMGNLEWYYPNFPNPAEMMSKWKEQGIHTIAITEPFFTSRCYNYSEMERRGYFADEDVADMGWLRSERVGLIDATNPEAMDWMWSFYKARTEEGMAGWWLDLGEPERHDADSRHLGGSVSQVHNEFGQLWIERVYNGFREEFPDMRPFIMPRSGTSGMQRFSTFPWTGDILRSWGGLAAQIPALINMSMSGVSYLGSDVGGFTAESTNPELYLRWVEFATFSPMMRTHSANNPEPTQPAYRDILPSVRDFINLRYRFLPYTYTLSYLNSAKGLPIARPACAFDSDPRKLAECNDAYLWGKDLYVAPVITSSNSRKITFPEGEWVDMNDLSRIYSGGESLIYTADVSTLPYFMRLGSFIPMFTQTSGFGSTSEIDYSDLTLLHYADTSREGISEGLLYEDDRKSASSLTNGDFTLLHFRGESDEHGNYAVTIEPETGGSTHFMPETRTLRIRLLGYNGTDVPELSITDRIPEIEEVAPEVPEIDPEEGEENTPEEERNLNREVQPIFELKSSREEVDAHPGHAYCLEDNGELYMKTTAPADSKVNITLGNISTGIDLLDTDKGITLEYVAGTLNYSLPTGSAGCRIEYYAADGRKTGVSEPLKADGKIHSVKVPEEKGFYLARLKGKSVKFIR